MASKIKNYKKLDKMGVKMIESKEEIPLKLISYVNCCDRWWENRFD